MNKLYTIMLAMLMAVTTQAQIVNIDRYDVDKDGHLTISDVTLLIDAYLGNINYPVTAVTLSETEVKAYVGQPFILKATITPANPDNPIISWSSSKEKVATVDDNGVVTPVAAGSTVIVAEAEDGKGAYATCKVTVVSDESTSDGGLTLTTLAAEATGPVTYTLNAEVKGLETLQSGTYSVFFYYSKTNSEPNAQNGTRVAATVKEANATYSLSNLDMCSTYYYRIAVVPFSGDIVYGPVRSFTVADLVTPGAEVDLGEGIIIAGYDLGSTTPEGKGNMYAWGETEAKTSFSLSNYSYYSTNADIYLGLGDCISGTEYDVATKILADGWKIPSTGDFSWLRGMCVWTSITYKGVDGYLVQSKLNGNAVFISSGNHWLGNVASPDSKAYYFESGSSNTINRYSGCYIRAIKEYDVTYTYTVGEAVDLGLSVKWANINVGASSPEEYGLYFAWGETTPKRVYNWSTYFDTTDGGSTFTKYNNNDGKTQLDPEYDAAHVNWGGNWRMPTRAEQDELRNNCTWTWTTQNGVKGYKVTSKTNGNSIFLPAAGCRLDGSLYDAGSYGNYWSSSLSAGGSSRAYSLDFGSGDVYWSYYRRYSGRSVRAVCQ